MTTNHTPTPWYASFAYGNGSALHVGGMILQGPQCLTKIEPPMDADTLQANAAHIVRCVNAYDELVAALEEIDRIALSHPYAAMTCGDVANIARAVLAKVQA
jgi:hypothetical protein